MAKEEEKPEIICCTNCKGKFNSQKDRAEHSCNTMAKFVRAEEKKEKKREKLKKVVLVQLVKHWKILLCMSV